jgi:hypothetical protein
LAASPEPSDSDDSVTSGCGGAAEVRMWRAAADDMAVPLYSATLANVTSLRSAERRRAPGGERERRRDGGGGAVVLVWEPACVATATAECGADGGGRDVVVPFAGGAVEVEEG